jgi:hypothetical protein
MPMRQLRHFQAVAEALGFSKSPRHIHVAQTAPSRAVEDFALVRGGSCTSQAAMAVRALIAEWLKSRKLWPK